MNDYTKTQSFLKLQPKAKTTLRHPVTVPFKGNIEVRLCGPDGDGGLSTATVTVDKEPHFYDLQL